MHLMSDDERVVAAAAGRFLYEGDDVVPLSPLLSMTIHRAGYSFADERVAIAKVTDAETGETEEYEIEFVVRRRARSGR